ncbi:restriction endonuclease subunit S [Bacillus atrophaeus]|uniref:restriction endonuclease subunit S n=1 Tax=Bacillus atrophaeus TaxID=1452 RepID=UPI002161A64C|nr:restriction endonuclease subunit S [Bacillus atrophaeus]MCY8932469.1 restriction endonuclease subunit S [Bacillus atrophaeus]MCY8940282.1 restriction endonuclease subunit S [Bacillus atrophaeus]MCY8944392.1 restriction endonuclease subunit S [Bacillus atrophaeus]
MSKKKKTIEELLEEALVSEDEKPYEVPENWVWTRMGDVIKINPSKPKLDLPHDQPCSFLPMNKVNPQTGKVDSLEEREFEKVKKGYTYFEENDVLFAKITPCMENGNTVIANGLINKFGFGSTEFYVFRTSEKIDERYVYFLLRSEKFRKQARAEMTGAVGQQRVPKKFLESYPFALPPLSEQKRIADKVERLLSKIEEAKQLIEEAKETFELRRAAILDKAFRGELTRKWRRTNVNIEDAEILYSKIKESKRGKRKKTKEINVDELRYSIPSNWKWVRLGDVFTITSGGTPKKTVPEFYDGNIPWVKTGEIKWNYIYESVEKITPDAVANSSAKILPKNSVLVAMYGQGLTRGRASILGIEATCNQAVCALLPNDYILPEFLYYYFMEGYQRFRQIAKGGNQENLSATVISEFIFPLPPLEEQGVIVDIVQGIFTKESMIQEVIEMNIDHLKQSILSKAFRGELGTNDLSEESAIELLKEVLQEQVK